MKDAITWFDIPTENFDRAVKFYSNILGRQIRVDAYMGQNLGFFPMDGMEGLGGDLMPPGLGNKPCANGARVYLSCQGIIDEVIGRVEKSGGKIIAPCQTSFKPARETDLEFSIPGWANTTVVRW
jgi:predicted enzyme related to lactoylglutathione lyase